MSVRAAVVIPAAGAGRRMGAPKAMLELHGQPMLRHTIAPFLAEPRVRAVIVVLDPAAAAAPPAWLAGLDARIRIVPGGAERGDSVRAGLRAVAEDVDVVLIHDAARPLVSGALVARALEAAAAGRSVVAAIPVTDTIHEVNEHGRVLSTPDRRRLWRAQTPQAFPRAVVTAAYDRAGLEGVAATDDAALVARYGEPVHVIEGDATNIKITTPADLALAEVLLARA